MKTNKRLIFFFFFYFLDTYILLKLTVCYKSKLTRTLRFHGGLVPQVRIGDALILLWHTTKTYALNKKCLSKYIRHKNYIEFHSVLYDTTFHSNILYYINKHLIIPLENINSNFDVIREVLHFLCYFLFNLE